MAEAVGSQGNVFSTDVDPQIIDFLKQQSKQKGLKNVIPVMVKPKGFDEFYQKNTFDVILASEIVPMIPDTEIFFLQLASSLQLEDLNRMLNDSTLSREFSPSIFNPKEKQLREYLVSLLNQEGVFESKNTKMTNTALLNLRLLNRLIIQDLLQTRVWEKAFSLDKLSSDQWEGLLRGRNKMSILLEMPEYELVQKHPVLIYHDVWELKRK